jgi:N-acyl-L-homoserine lactone synthetase
MIRVIEGAETPGTDPLLDAMYRDRKRVFVDLRKWKLPILHGEYEVDQFDGPRTVYCIATDGDGSHLGSIRLLPSNGPHTLSDLFPDLCSGEVPTGSDIWELTRACISTRLVASERRRVRNALTTAAVEYALWRGISTYTCIADSGWLSQVLALGWDCRPLGPPRLIERSMTGALQINITPDTPALLEDAGTYVRCRLVAFDDAIVAHA